MLYEEPEPRLYKDKDGNLQIETHDEMMSRIKKADNDRYEKELKEIMKNDFTRKQAIYLHKMNINFKNALRPRIY